WNNPTLRSLALVAAAWQLLHHMQIAVLILFATRDLGLSAGAIGVAYMAGGLGCVLAASSAERLSRRFGVGPLIVFGLLLTAFGWQGFGLIRGSTPIATLALGAGMMVFDFGAVLWGINYLSLRQALTPDRLLGRMTATMRFLAVAAAPLGSLAGARWPPASGCARRCGSSDCSASCSRSSRCAGRRCARIGGCRRSPRRADAARSSG